jgi:hypothetical protein
MGVQKVFLTIYELVHSESLKKTDSATANVTEAQMD